MPDGEAPEVRLARLETQAVATHEALTKAALERDSLADEFSVMRVTLGTLGLELGHVRAELAGLAASLRWFVRLVVGSLLTAVLGAIVTLVVALVLAGRH